MQILCLTNFFETMLSLLLFFVKLESVPFNSFQNQFQLSVNNCVKKFAEFTSISQDF